GKVVHKLTAKNVPVDGFWSISLYNAKGFFQKNVFDAYSLNNLSAKANQDGSVTVQFGGCQKNTANCLPIGRHSRCENKCPLWAKSGHCTFGGKADMIFCAAHVCF
ncbi:MAG: DUF1214 domain-containing protein, partial [Pseudolabrys sp.]